MGAALGACTGRGTALESYGQGAWLGARHVGVGLAISVLHGVRVGTCDVTEGLAMMSLGGGVGAVLGGGGGALLGWLARGSRRPRRAALGGAALMILGSWGLSAWRFWSSPMVFAFDPFFGHLAGPLYDTVVDSVQPLLSYRVGTACSLLALGVLAAHLSRAPRLRCGWRSWPWALLGLAAGSLSLLHSASGPALGHWNTAQSIRDALGRQLDGERCHLYYSADVSRGAAELLGRECEQHLQELDAWFEEPFTGQVDVYLFANGYEKLRAMGAASTYIAKPWRREVYLQASGFPHPVLGHELAHVVAGAVGAGPLRVSGRWGGLIPDPGKIEGVATAASPDASADATLEQWSAALLELELLPPLRQIFALEFLSFNSSTAYTVAGAFVRFLHERWGAGAVRRWYAGASLESVTGLSLEALERAWRADLAQVQLSPSLLAAARARFERPSIFGRRCPRVVDRLDGEANARLNARDGEGARARYERLLGLDPGHYWARLGLVRCAQLRGEGEAATTQLLALAGSDALTSLQRAGALEALGDQELALEHYDNAARHYEAALPQLVGEDRLRTLEVKLDAARQAHTEPGRVAARAVAALLIGDLQRGRESLLTGQRLAEWATVAPEEGLPHYLLGRGYLSAERYELAAQELELALARRLRSERVQREALRLRLVTACALRDREAVTRAEVAWRALPSSPMAQREAVERLARRCLQ